MEREVIEGGHNFFKQNRGKVFLMIEDFIDNSIVSFLYKQKVIFIQKLTPYNSWWVI